MAAASFVIYLAVGIWLFYRRRPVLAGVAMGVVAFLPSLWQAVFTDSEAKGEGVITGLLLIPALLIILCGGIAALLRFALKHRRSKATQGGG
jgi:hypothetical protein